jgi:sulfur-oxidizing protein SoxA
VKRWFVLLLVVLWAQPLFAETRSFAHRPDLSADVIESGTVFLTPETRSLQEDDFANPGYLWVDRGRELFTGTQGATSCAGCHSEPDALSLKGAAARYPQYEPRLGRLLNLEGRINQCRARYQELPSLRYESEDLLALAAYVANLSRGMAFDVRIEGQEKPFYEQGRAYFFQRRGQLNLACNQCHDDNWGKLLRGDRISQGHPNAWPGYRLEWQTFGSLHRRLQDCDAGVRAQPNAGGSEVYTNLELYLAWRARELPLESPGVRR